MRFNQHHDAHAQAGFQLIRPRETSAELISPDLGAQLRNVATINDRGEMAVVAFFPTGVIAQCCGYPAMTRAGKMKIARVQQI
jgi:hypothetical protein